MDPLDKIIPEIQTALAAETDPDVFTDLLAEEKKGKKRKVLKRWLRAEIKLLTKPKFIMHEDTGEITTKENRIFHPGWGKSKKDLKTLISRARRLLEDFPHQTI